MAVLVLLSLISLLFTPKTNAVSVGFSASQINAQQQPNSQVIYHNVITNVGDAYDSSTGAFTCPIQGLYSFSVGGLSMPGNTMVLDLYVSGRYLISIQAIDRLNHPSGSRTVVIECKKGEKVYVINRGFVTVYATGGPNYEHNIFSGFLINPTF
ncbi:Complement C1q-like protein 2 [Bulinus truncatus]|nr:Complement C1q-like protein 2 [Bulinus truncatus]